MRFAALFQTRAFLILAASLAGVAILILLAEPPGGKVATPQLPVLPAGEPPAIQGSDARMSPPARQMEANLQPRTTPRRAAEADLASVFPPSELPAIVTAPLVRVSLGCLAKNGADLSKPMPSRHSVFAANEQVAARMRAWAQAHGFEVRNSEVVREHTGTPRVRFDLVRVEVPDPEAIAREGRLVLEAVHEIPGTYYQTWSGEVVR